MGNGLRDKRLKITGGYIILARKLFNGEVMNKSPLFFKLWVWMLDRAMWKDTGNLKRGQLITTIAEMQEAMSYRAGYRKMKPTKGEIRNSYEALTASTMISTTKSTRGMVITILNYDFYQNPANYEPHTGQHNETDTGSTVTTQDKEEGEEMKKEISKDMLPLCRAWKAFIEMRKKIKKPLTDYAIERAIMKLERLAQDGNDPLDVLNQSIDGCWQGLFPLREIKNERQYMPPRSNLSYQEQRQARAASVRQKNHEAAREFAGED